MSVLQRPPLRILRGYMLLSLPELADKGTAWTQGLELGLALAVADQAAGRHLLRLLESRFAEVTGKPAEVFESSRTGVIADLLGVIREDIASQESSCGRSDSPGG